MWELGGAKSPALFDLGEHPIGIDMDGQRCRHRIAGRCPERRLVSIGPGDVELKIIVRHGRFVLDRKILNAHAGIAQNVLVAIG